MKRIFCCFIVLLIVSIHANAKGFNPDTLHFIKRPKVGLVLSGGGAKGFAHIGVLKTLEEVGIRPDYITGTSMGSIIGGLYSLGYSANELDSIVVNVNWAELLSDKIPLSSVVPIEKESYTKEMFRIAVGRKGPSVPRGLMSGQGISEELNYLSWRAVGVDDFDDYPIPFRCVAADIVSGKQYVFDSGSLPVAMRASMAIPTVFSPVIIDSMMLVDGGVLNNMPVVECRELGADIIIAVNVGTVNSNSLNSYKSVLDVLMGSAMISNNISQGKAEKLSDILITPSLGKYGSASFSNTEAIVDSGFVASEAQVDELKCLAEYLKSFPEDADNVKDLPLKDSIKISLVSIDSLASLDEKFVRGKFGIKEGDYCDKEEVKEGIHRLIGTRYIKGVDYTLEPFGDGYNINLEITESPKNEAGFAVHYDNVYNAGLIIRRSMRNAIFKGSHLNVAVDISEYPRVEANYYDHIGETQNFGIYSINTWEKNYYPLYVGPSKDMGYFNQSYLRIGAGGFYSVDTKMLISLGAYFKVSSMRNVDNLTMSTLGEFDHFGNNWFGLVSFLSRSTVDKQFFANEGSHLSIKFDVPVYHTSRYSGVDSVAYEISDLTKKPEKLHGIIQFDYNKYRSLGKGFNLQGRAFGGYVSEGGSYVNYFKLGGEVSSLRSEDIGFYGLVPREVITQSYYGAGLNLRYTPIENFLHLSLVGNAMGVHNSEEFMAFGTSFPYIDKDFIAGGGVELALETVIGPIKLAYTRNNIHNHARIYFNVGFSF